MALPFAGSSPAAPASKKVKVNKEKLLTHLATLGPAGYFPFAPGTMGSAVSALLLYLLRPSDQIIVFSFIILFFTGTYASRAAEEFFGQKDSPRIIIDEFVALPLGLLFIKKTLLSITLGFFLFRVFDILKPFPIRRIENSLSGGLSVMLDDVLAAFYTNIALHMVYNLFVQ